MSLLLKLGNEIQKSNSDDIRVATDAEALLTKLETVITSDINNFITAKISKDKDTGFTKASLLSADTIRPLAFSFKYSGYKEEFTLYIMSPVL